MYKVADFFYNLPPELIAQKPVKKRDQSRLLILNKSNGNIIHSRFYKLIDFLNFGDVLVLNNSKVFPARLIAKKIITNGTVEILLHQRKEKDMNKVAVWECLLKGRVRIGLELTLSDNLKAKVVKDNKDGIWLVRFNLVQKEFFEEINKIGQVPLPPYIKREQPLQMDKIRYQTIFAKDDKAESAAAPTAGLHFSNQLLNKLKSKGIKIKFITLHVGLGTFAPVKSNNIKDHKMHSEFLEINLDTLKAISEAKKTGQRIIAVGTTTCRALEAGADRILSFDKQTKNKEDLSVISFWTDIFIYPGYNFRIIDGLITNFHLPKSTLLMLVSALAGKNNIERAYQEAIMKKYRFFSYGDAMFII
jgi:S-adenosylmethionine:tRNA ribosyltransferase-isomerase